MPEKKQNIHNHTIERAPVIAIMGHVDHGKSTLLDYIRKTNIVETETGGITQKISAYEVIHKARDGKEHKMTFLDTPGHEAFTAIRSRGAKVADIAVLVVSAEDGVKPQTLEALKIIQAAKIPYIVAINKIDKEGANIDRTKVNLAENGVYVEGFGGDISFVPISAKTGQGVHELLDLIVLTAQLGEFTGDPAKPAEGVIIEAHLDKKKGVTVTIVIKNGTLKTGTHIIAGTAYSPVRILENFLGKPIKEATFSSPVRLIGWNEIPAVGASIKVFESKRDAEEYIAHVKSNAQANKNQAQRKTSAHNQENADTEREEIATLPIILKAYDVGGLDALKHEVNKLKHEKLKIKIIQASVGDITEADVKLASGKAGTIILGFNVKTDTTGKSLAEKTNVEIQVFDIIYKLSEWLQQTVQERAPKTIVDEATGTAKVLKIFSKVRDRHVLGGRVEKGQLLLGAEVKILRRDFEIGRGKVKELQRFKNRAAEIPEGQEFGALVESKIEIAPGDKLEAFTSVEK